MSEFNTLSEIIHKRRSIFPAMYVEKEISDDVIRSILENANCAPTHKKTEPWRFKVIKGETLHGLSNFLGDFYKENTAPEHFSPMKYKKTIGKPLKCGCVIAICMQRDPEERIPEWEEIAAVACAVQNMWLSCTALDIGCYWSSPKAINSMQSFLSLGKGEKCLGLFYMGHKKEGDYAIERGKLENKIQWL